MKWKYFSLFIVCTTVILVGSTLEFAQGFTIGSGSATYLDAATLDANCLVIAVKNGGSLDLGTGTIQDAGSLMLESGAAFVDTTGTPISYCSGEVSYLLWTNTSDNQASLWGLQGGSIVYGPFAGYTAASYYRNSDNTAQLLWTHTDGTANVWTLDFASRFSSSQIYGPVAGWTAVSYHRNSDDTAQLLWTHTDGTANIWTLNSSGVYLSDQTYPPVAGWTAVSYHRNSDDTAQLLWTHTDGTANIWTLNSSGQYLSSQTYGPVAGWTAVSYHRNSDNTAQLLWTHTDGTATIWTLNSSGIYLSDQTYGPTSGMVALDYHGSTSSAARGAALPGSAVEKAFIVVRKAGSGRGTIFADAQECGRMCPELVIPYVEHATETLQVVPDPDSVFVRWETAEGAPLEGIHYAQPGETVIAVFEKQ